ncbi:MAG: topoisomerase DNA-binding C4 zinc finger domain-containing protein, partial [Muribaculaceae bacterium]|nr:topoisomerase DNA-binding C4 zinc finger domain-containing protein [Muribaculaceae bacterium]
SSRKAVVIYEYKVVMSMESMRGEFKRRPKVLTREEMEDIAERIKGMVTGEASRRRHVADVRRTARSKERDIRSGICPRCGGRLILREGRTGPFLGCSNYPQCRFTCEP